MRTDDQTARWGRYLLIAVNAAAIVVPIGYALAYSRAITTPARAAVPILLGLAIAVVHGHNMLAAARGVRPRYGGWSLVLLALLIYPPLWWIGLSWGITQTTLIASALIVLRRRAAIVTVGLVLLAAGSYATYIYSGRPGGVDRLVFDVFAAIAFDAIVGVALYGAARLVRVLYDTQAAQAELAAIAAGRERLRVSRDLHDLLGQSLSAVSLKGDLAVRLVEHDEAAARAEIRSVGTIARDALRGVRAVTHNTHDLTAAEELESGVALLRSAGIRTTVDAELAGLTGAPGAVIAWAVREGVTNVLRHSDAQTCVIRAGREGAQVWLEIVNDGAADVAWPGSSAGPARMLAGAGLTGLAARARAGSGSLSAGPGPDGTFRLRIEVAELVGVAELVAVETTGAGEVVTRESP